MRLFEWTKNFLFLIESKVTKIIGLLTITGFILALVGLFMSISTSDGLKELRESDVDLLIQYDSLATKYSALTNKYDDLATDFHSISDDLTTKKVPNYPENFEYIHDLILNYPEVDQATDKHHRHKYEILIATDYPAYGFLSRTADYYNYTKKIEDLVKSTQLDVKVTLLVYDISFIKKTTPVEFDKMRNLDTLNKYIQSRVENFPPNYPRENLSAQMIGEIDSFNELIDFCISYQEGELRDYRRLEANYTGRFEFKTSPSYIPNFLWIVKRNGELQRGIVNFPNYIKVAETGFSTEDSDMLKILEELFLSADQSKEFN